MTYLVQMLNEEGRTVGYVENPVAPNQSIQLGVCRVCGVIVLGEPTDWYIGLWLCTQHLEEHVDAVCVPDGYQHDEFCEHGCRMDDVYGCHHTQVDGRTPTPTL